MHHQRPAHQGDAPSLSMIDLPHPTRVLLACLLLLLHPASLAYRILGTPAVVDGDHGYFVGDIPRPIETASKKFKSRIEELRLSLRCPPTPFIRTNEWQVAGERLLYRMTVTEECKEYFRIENPERLKRFAGGYYLADWISGVFYVRIEKRDPASRAHTGRKVYVALVVQRGRVLHQVELDEAPT